MPVLNEFDLLLVIAQVSVAFAGFASLASALRDRANPEETRVDAGRLKNMLIVSLCTAMLSLAPTIPALFRFTEDLVWRSSAVAALVSMALFSPGIMRRTKRMKLYAGFSIGANAINFGIAAMATLAFVACAAGFPATHPSASYVAGLAALLLICAIVFYRVIASLLRPHAPD